MPVIKGTKDIFSPEIGVFDHLYSLVDKIYSLYGYEKIETPVIEYTDLFSRSIGGFTDIVQKEMFTLQDRKGRNITLRPEGTAGVIRAYLDNNFSQDPGVKKLYYYGSMFRAENPQKGRLRQFHQFGSEAVGSLSPLLDAEVIFMNWELLTGLGLKNLALEVNSVGCRLCRPSYTEKLVQFLNKNSGALCENCRTRKDSNPLRVFDCKNPECQKAFERAPLLTDHLCKECSGHFQEVKQILEQKNIPYTVHKQLVRGFDYYTKTVFEVKSGSLGSQNALLGGGRYDYLVELLGGAGAPAVGSAAGMERIILALEEEGVKVETAGLKRVFVATAGTVDRTLLLSLPDRLRRQGFQTFLSYGEKGLKAQLKEADRLGCGFCLILGEEELKRNAVILRFLARGEQKEVPLEEFSSRAGSILS